MLAIILLSSIMFISPWGDILAESSESLHLLRLHLKSNEDFIPRYLYHISKFYEYLDIIFFVADGGDVDLHFGFHHLTTPYLTYFRVLNDHRGWEVFAALNAFHHAIMYSFFAGAKSVHVALPFTRNIQLVVGILWDIWLMIYRDPGVNIMGRGIAIFLLTSYLILMTREIRMKRSAEKTKAG
jgi:hypothetical protein